MNRLARRALGLLPLVVGLGLVGAWVWTGAPSRARERIESDIRLRWESATEAPSVAVEVASYLGRFGAERDAVWFAVDTYAHLRDPVRALDAVTSRPAVRDEPGAARKFARLLIEPLRRKRGTAEVKTALASRILHVLLEAEDRDAQRDWVDLAMHLSTPEAMTIFVPGSRTPSIGTTAIGTALAARTENRELRCAGAILLAGPRHNDDVPFLLDVFRSSWRDERRPMWQHVVRALGSTGDPRAIEALTTFVDPTSGDPRLPTRATIDLGLALAGDREARARLLADQNGVGMPRVLSLYGAGLAVQLAQGDERAIPRLVELWNAATDPMFRFQLAEAVLDADPLPPKTFPAERWADEFVQSDKVLFRALGHAWRFRMRRETAFESLGADLVEAAALVNFDDLRSPEDTGPGALIQVLRAWLRYGG